MRKKMRVMTLCENEKKNEKPFWASTFGFGQRNSLRVDRIFSYSVNQMDHTTTTLNKGLPDYKRHSSPDISHNITTSGSH